MKPSYPEHAANSKGTPVVAYHAATISGLCISFEIAQQVVFCW
jgi:hypothetical protein